MMRRVIGILTCVAVFCGAAVVLESRAADSPPASPSATKLSQAAPTKAAANPAAGKPPVTKPSVTKPPVPGAPQVPEESATIRDDPTIVPDPKQSADNNVSFPNDI